MMYAKDSFNYLNVCKLKHQNKNKKARLEARINKIKMLFCKKKYKASFIDGYSKAINRKKKVEILSKKKKDKRQIGSFKRYQFYPVVIHVICLHWYLNSSHDRQWQRYKYRSKSIDNYVYHRLSTPESFLKDYFLLEISSLNNQLGKDTFLKKKLQTRSYNYYDQSTKGKYTFELFT